MTTRDQAIQLAKNCLNSTSLNYGKLVGAQETVRRGSSLWLVVFKLDLPEEEIDFGMDTVMITVDKRTGHASVFESL